MGWYADTDWNVTVLNPSAAAAAIRAAAATRAETAGDTDWMIRSLDAGPDDAAVIGSALALVNEESDFQLTDLPDGALQFRAWGTGKAYPDVTEPPSTRTRTTPDGPRIAADGGIDLYAILAQYAYGSVEWSSEGEGEHWRVRFADGQVHTYNGWVVFPGDPDGDLPIPRPPHGSHYTCPQCSSPDVRREALIDANPPYGVHVLDEGRCNACGASVIPALTIIATAEEDPA